MKKLNQQGIAGTLVILILVLVLAVGGIGYYVYSAKKNTEATLNSTANSQGDPQKSEKKTADKPAEKPKEAPKKYLEIKEWNVKLELTDANSDAYYAMKNGYVYLSLTSLKNVDDCAADKTSLGAVTRAKPEEKENENSTQTYGDQVKAGYGSTVNGYAYVYTSPQANCTENNAYVAKIGDARQAFVSKIKSLQAL